MRPEARGRARNLEGTRAPNGSFVGGVGVVGIIIFGNAGSVDALQSLQLQSHELSTRCYFRLGERDHYKRDAISLREGGRKGITWGVANQNGLFLSVGSSSVAFRIFFFFFFGPRRATNNQKKNPKLKPATHRMTSPQAKELTQQAAANRLAQQQQQREQTGEALYPAEGPEERDRKR